MTVMVKLYGERIFESLGRVKNVCVLGRVLISVRLGGCTGEPWRVFRSLVRNGLTISIATCPFFWTLNESYDSIDVTEAKDLVFRFFAVTLQKIFYHPNPHESGGFFSPAPGFIRPYRLARFKFIDCRCS